MKSQMSRPLTTSEKAEYVVSAYFDGIPQPLFFPELAAFFGTKADPLNPPLRKPALREAENLLYREGLQPKFIKRLGLALTDKLDKAIDELVSRKSNPVTIKKIDWSDRHYLGIKIITPSAKIEDDADIFNDLRSSFRHTVAQSMIKLPNDWMNYRPHELLAYRQQSINILATV